MGLLGALGSAGETQALLTHGLQPLLAGALGFPGCPAGHQGNPSSADLTGHMEWTHQPCATPLTWTTHS
jgi:hypothetical protein